MEVAAFVRPCRSLRSQPGVATLRTVMCWCSVLGSYLADATRRSGARAAEIVPPRATVRRPACLSSGAPVGPNLGSMSDLRPRPVTQVITAHRQREGAGFIVRRPFPTACLGLVDPFLLLDEMGPIDYAPGRAVGAPDHPHRGFETVSYILQGELEHEDSVGHRGRLGPGDVQWMTAHLRGFRREFCRRGECRGGRESTDEGYVVNSDARSRAALRREQGLGC